MLSVFISQGHLWFRIYYLHINHQVLFFKLLFLTLDSSLLRHHWAGRSVVLVLSAGNACQAGHQIVVFSLDFKVAFDLLARKATLAETAAGQLRDASLPEYLLWNIDWIPICCRWFEHIVCRFHRVLEACSRSRLPIMLGCASGGGDKFLVWCCAKNVVDMLSLVVLVST